MQYKLPDQISEQMTPFFAPFAALWEANLKAVETVVEQQTKLLDDVVVSCAELADELTKADSVEAAWETQKSYSAKLQELCTASIKNTPLAFQESEALLVEVLASAGDFGVFTYDPTALVAEVAATGLKPVETKTVKPRAATKKASSKASAKKEPSAKAQPKKATAKRTKKAEVSEVKAESQPAKSAETVSDSAGIPSEESSH